MTIFGPAWHELELADLQAFLEDAPSEPLEWEAKGGSELNPGKVRAQVCGFANGYDVGYLILGAQEGDGGWTLGGIVFPNGDPASDISDLIASGGVTPYPDGLSVRSFEVGGGRHVAVVRIPPVAVPPCTTRGTLFERVSGKTIAVTDPVRVSALFQRGDSARAHAQAVAERAASAAMGLGRRRDPGDIQLALGLAASGYQPDISSRLFAGLLDAAMREQMKALAARDILTHPSGAPFVRTTTQDALALAIDPTHEFGDGWIVRADWAGGVGLHWGAAMQSVAVETITERLGWAWTAAEAVMAMLDPLGPRYVHVIAAGGPFPINRDPPRPWPRVRRGPLPAGVSDDVLASIRRELQRARGHFVLEDGPELGGSL
jgi:hypothetical protein